MDPMGFLLILFRSISACLEGHVPAMSQPCRAVSPLQRLQPWRAVGSGPVRLQNSSKVGAHTTCQHDANTCQHNGFLDKSPALFLMISAVLTCFNYPQVHNLIATYESLDIMRGSWAQVLLYPPSVRNLGVHRDARGWWGWAVQFQKGRAPRLRPKWLRCFTGISRRKHVSLVASNLLKKHIIAMQGKNKNIQNKIETSS